MKKIFILITLLFLTFPALAYEWKFYGSARIGTFYDYSDKDYNKTTENLSDSDMELNMAMLSTSRIGVDVKNDKAKGKVEIGGVANLRLLYGKYDFNNFKMLVGQDWSLLSNIDNGQVYDNDNGLAGLGLPFEGRVPQIRFEISNFQFAFLQPAIKGALGSPDNNTEFYKENYLIPKLEFKYNMNFSSSNLILSGGYQITEIKYKKDDYKEKTENINAFLISFHYVHSFKYLSLKITGSYGYNQSNMGQSQGGILTQNINDNMGLAYYNNGDLKHQDTYMFAFVLIGKINKTFSYEAGYGYRLDLLQEKPNGWENKDNQIHFFYANLPITLAKNTYIIPETGYITFNDDLQSGNNRGNHFYLGAKWQINF
jgi:hypothetical protein